MPAGTQHLVLHSRKNIMATINGTSFADNLVGTGGADTINGRAGNDVIRGGGGRDTITLGSGRDTVVYAGVTDSPFASNWDLITDFTRGEDQIDLSTLLGATDLIWGGLNVTANGVWYGMVGTTLSIFIDTNGAPATPEMRIDLQNMSTTTVLTVNDFIGVAVQMNAAPLAGKLDDTREHHGDRHRGGDRCGQRNGDLQPGGGWRCGTLRHRPQHWRLQVRDGA
jgi:hypothetical protein